MPISHSQEQVVRVHPVSVGAGLGLALALACLHVLCEKGWAFEGWALTKAAVCVQSHSSWALLVAA